MDPQTHCPIFRLPRELRDIIYQHVLETETSEQVPLNGAEIAAPQLDLPVMCRRICDEAMQLHQAAYTAFWSSKTFTISDNLDFTEASITARHIEYMAHVMMDTSSLRKWFKNEHAGIFGLVSTPGSGVWRPECRHDFLTWSCVELFRPDESIGKWNDKSSHPRGILTVLRRDRRSNDQWVG